MDFNKKKATTGVISGFDLGLTTIVLVVASYKIIEAVLLRLSPEPGAIPITYFTMVKHIVLWFGLFALHVVPLCNSYALYHITGKGREEILKMIEKCRAWLKSTLYLLIALFIMFILFSLHSDVQSYVGAGVCAVEILIRLFSRCFVSAFYESLSTTAANA